VKSNRPDGSIQILWDSRWSLSNASGLRNLVSTWFGTMKLWDSMRKQSSQLSYSHCKIKKQNRQISSKTIQYQRPWPFLSRLWDDCEIKKMNKNKILASQTTEEKWKQAQKWEEAHWVNAQRARAKFCKNLVWRFLSIIRVVPKYRGDDWNNWWMDKFDNYSFLPNEVENAIELGCGPYTNVRLMLSRCNIKHLVLSDPLIHTYVKFKYTFVRDMYETASCMLDDHPMEQLPYKDNHFDLAIMINVLDHVRDANECMNNLLRVVKPGGIIILGQDLSREEDAEALLNDSGLVGHPIKLEAEWFTPWLDTCEPIFEKVLQREEGRNDDKHHATLIFAGRLKNKA